MKEIKKGLKKASKEFNKIYDKGRYQRFGKYVFDRHIFRACTVICLALLLVVIIGNGFSFSQKFYYHCPSDASMGFCESPFYNSPQKLPPAFEELKQEEFLPAGLELGEKPSWFVSNFSLLVFGIFIAGLIINHIKNNKDFKFKEVKVEVEE